VVRRPRSPDAVARCECGALFRVKGSDSGQMRLENLKDAIGELFGKGK
jgi:hypothetical protein